MPATEARTRRSDPDEPLWGFAEELLAQIVEEVSLVVSNRTRKEPREVPRPSDMKAKARRTGVAGSPLMRAAMASGRVRFRG